MYGEITRGEYSVSSFKLHCIDEILHFVLIMTGVCFRHGTAVAMDQFAYVADKVTEGRSCVRVE